MKSEPGVDVSGIGVVAGGGGCTVGVFGSRPLCVTGSIWWCSGVWGRPAGSQIIVLPIFPASSFSCNIYMIISQFSFNLINFQIPDQPIPPISLTSLCTHFTDRLSVYTAQSIPNLNSSPNSSATHFPKPMRVNEGYHFSYSLVFWLAT